MPSTGPHTAIARLDSSGTLSLTLDDRPDGPFHQPAVGSPPCQADGLDVGEDRRAAVGPYKSHTSRGTIVRSPHH